MCRRPTVLDRFHQTVTSYMYIIYYKQRLIVALVMTLKLFPMDLCHDYPVDFSTLTKQCVCRLYVIVAYNADAFRNY